MKAIFFSRSYRMCGGILLAVLIEEQQTTFWTEDSLTDCK